jgi:nitrite reductase/ring-hydroxylating ferredoxin subunit
VPGTVRLCLSGKLPKEGRFRPMRAGRRSFCVAQQNGQFQILDGLCPHKDLPLGKGKLEDGKIVCPWHGWCFDPATGQPQKGRTCLKIYPAVQEENQLFLILA